MPDPADFRVVQRDQCSGRDLSCIGCERPMGKFHTVLCYVYANARREAEREMGEGSNTGS